MKKVSILLLISSIFLLSACFWNKPKPVEPEPQTPIVEKETPKEPETETKTETKTTVKADPKTDDSTQKMDDLIDDIIGE